MKRLNIFKAGTHTSAAGVALTFSESDLQASVDAYDPSLHEAPITVGHPKDNLPAYGWIKSLSFSEQRGLDAVPHQVFPDFAEMVSNNLFKKISASFYAPDSPTNPVPGVYYLRHVAFLGAQPPAVKGLKSVEYSEAEEGIVEFSEDWDANNIATLFRRLRDFLIEKFTKEEADEVLPEWAVGELQDSARRKNDAREAERANSFNEPEDPEMDKNQLEAEKQKLNTRESEIASKEADFAEREKRIKEAETKALKQTVAAKIDALVLTGKLLPAERERITEFCCALNGEVNIEFSEGDKTKKASLSDVLFEFLEGLDPRVDTSERSSDDKGDAEPKSPAEISRMAIEYREEQLAKGIEISATAAVMHVQKQHADQ